MIVSNLLPFQATLLLVVILCCYISIGAATIVFAVPDLIHNYTRNTHPNSSNATEASILKHSTLPNTNNITVRKGHDFQIVLDSNPSTGYQWHAVFDANDLKLKSHTFEVSSKLAVGSPVKEEFTFSAMQSGTTTLEFLYKRSFEPEPIEEKAYEINIF